jgi:hypothetical protein
VGNTLYLEQGRVRYRQKRRTKVSSFIKQKVAWFFHLCLTKPALHARCQVCVGSKLQLMYKFYSIKCSFSFTRCNYNNNNNNNNNNVSEEKFHMPIKRTVPWNGDRDESYSPQSNTSVNVKTGFPDPADFATTRLLIRRLSPNGWAYRWHIAAFTVWYAKELCPICHSQQILADFTSTRLQIYWHIALWWPRYANRRPNHCANCQHSPMDYMPSYSKICQIWWPAFNIDGYATLWTTALKRPIFKRKKGLRTLV